MGSRLTGRAWYDPARVNIRNLRPPRTSGPAAGPAGGPDPRRGLVGLVDDDPQILRALGRLLRTAGYEVLPFASAEECLGGLDGLEPDCLLVDLALPGLDGLGLQRALVEREVASEVVFLTGHGDVPSSVQAFKHGALDFLEKPVEGDRLLAALDQAIARQAERRREGADLQRLRAAYETLTLREQEVLEEVVHGRLNKQVAGRLAIAEGTVKVHRRQVMRKMGADSLAELVRRAARLGIPAGGGVAPRSG